MKKNLIHISLCWEDKDGEYTKFPATTITSILENNKDVFFHLVTQNISEENKTRIVSLVNNYGGRAVFYEKFNPEAKKIMDLIKENNKSTFVDGSYLRLLLPFLVSKKINKMIYLDSDIIVNGSLEGLWNISLGERLLAGLNYENHVKQKIWKLEQYINTGVLLMDLDKIRTMNLYDKLISTFKKYKDDFYFTGRNSFADQDVINIVFDGQITFIGEKYHFIVDKNKFQYGKIIYHYIWSLKPFRFRPCFIDSKYKELYFYYFDKTPWKGWRPKLNLREGIKTSRIYDLLTNLLRYLGLEILIKKLLNKKNKKRI